MPNTPTRYRYLHGGFAELFCPSCKTREGFDIRISIDEPASIFICRGCQEKFESIDMQAMADSIRNFEALHPEDFPG